MKQGVMTDGDWAVMTAFWDTDGTPMTLSSAISKIGDVFNWQYRTYASYINKLVARGFLAFDVRSRGDKYYYAAVTREECIRSESRDILGRVTIRHSDELFMCLADECNMSDADKERLRLLVSKLSAGGGS